MASHRPERYRDARELHIVEGLWQGTECKAKAQPGYDVIGYGLEKISYGTAPMRRAGIRHSVDMIGGAKALK